MKVRVLGCSGGLGGAPNRTTSFLVDHDILIDAGTGVGDLTLEELAAIRYVFLTHSHLDHLAALPLMVDTVGDRRDGPLAVIALPETIDALKAHIFNWVIWPDFTRIPTQNAPFMCYRPIAMGESIEIAGRTISTLPANHVVPTVGYCVEGGHGAWAFSGDTADCPALWARLNEIANLKVVVIETAFPDEASHIAQASKHYYPSLLAQDLDLLEGNPQVFITHLKPGFAVRTMTQIERAAQKHEPGVLEAGQVFDL
ncbi:MAG: hypothetical protein RIR70_852 [Pseudomonadota bacterium]|jgi:cAMP phosphodiesterase